MRASDDYVPPQRSVLERILIRSWEYRRLRASGVTRIAGGSVLAVGGVLLLSYGSYGWAALFLVLGALNLGGGYWYITIARSSPPRA